VVSGGELPDVREGASVSEFQFYQFLSCDGRLTKDQVAEVRALSTRARLTRTSFVNTYQWGDFKGDPQRLMERYYDAHLYFANWGTRRLMLRWDASVLALEAIGPYLVEPVSRAWRQGEHVIVCVESDREDEDFDDLFGPYDADADREEQWLPSIAAVRTAVADADHRFLYLLWLLAVQDDAVDPDSVEPPLPAGLAALDESLADLCTFLRLDRDLVAAAAEPSPGPAAPTTGADLAAGIARTAGAIRAARDHHRRSRLEQEAREAADRRERRQRAAQEARDQRIAKLRGHEDEAWKRVEVLVAAMKAGPYDEAAVLVADLAALARKLGTGDAFTHRYRQLRLQHNRKKAFLARLDAVGL